MTVRLRAHHLLCMLTFVGKGYTPAFTRNYRRIAERLTAGEGIMLVSGPDDICCPLLKGADPHCRAESVATRDALAAEAVSRLLGHELHPGAAIAPNAALLKRLRQAFATGEVRKACGGCEWEDLCSGISADGYAGILVDPP